MVKTKSQSQSLCRLEARREALQLSNPPPVPSSVPTRYGKEELLHSSMNLLLASSHRECTNCGMKKARQHFGKGQLKEKNRFTIRCMSCIMKDSRQLHTGQNYVAAQIQKKQMYQQQMALLSPSTASPTQQRRQQQQHYTQQQQQQQNTTPGRRQPPGYSYSHTQMGPHHQHHPLYHRPTATTTTTTTNYAQQYVLPTSVSPSVSSSMSSRSRVSNSYTNNTNTSILNTNHNPSLQQKLPPLPPRCLTMLDHENDDDDDASTMFDDDSSMWQELENMTMTRLRIADEKTMEAAMTKAATTPTTVTVQSGTGTATTTTHSEEDGEGNGNDDTLLLVGSTLDFDWFELLRQKDEEVSFEFKLEGASTSPLSTIHSSDDLLDASSLWMNNNPWLQKQQQQQQQQQQTM